MAVGKVGVLDTVGAAVRFAKANTRAAIGPLIVTAVASAAAFIGQYINEPRLAAAGIVQFLAMIMAMGALLRGALASAHPGDPSFKIGPAGFQWGAHEWRLLGSLALLVLVFMAVIVLVVFVAVILLIATGAPLEALAALAPNTSPEELVRIIGPQRVLGLTILYLLFAIGFLWLAIRLSLYAPATVDTKAVAIFSSWSLTKGHVWRAFGVLLLCSLPSVALSMVIGAIQRALGHQVGLGQFTLDLSIAAPLAAVVGIVGAFVQLPLNTGAYVELYRRLSGRSQLEVF